MVLFSVTLLMDPAPEVLAVRAMIVVGLLVVAAGEAVRIWAAGHLYKNERVVTSGPYAYVKNPLYLGTFLIMVGFCMMASKFVFLAIGLVVFVAYYAPFKQRRESGRLRERFGDNSAKRA